MDFVTFEANIKAVLNESELSDSLVTAKVQQAVKKVETLWNFPYMWLETAMNIQAVNSPVIWYNTVWKSIVKLATWDPETIDSTLVAHGLGATNIKHVLRKRPWNEIDDSYLATLNDTDSWGDPLEYSQPVQTYVEDPILGSSAPKVLSTQINLFPPPDETMVLSAFGYVFTSDYTTATTEPHWLLSFGGELVEAWTIISLAPAIRDKDMLQFYKEIVPSAQSNLLKYVINDEYVDTDIGAIYDGSQDVR